MLQRRQVPTGCMPSPGQPITTPGAHLHGHIVSQTTPSAPPHAPSVPRTTPSGRKSAPPMRRNTPSGPGRIRGAICRSWPGKSHAGSVKLGTKQSEERQRNLATAGMGEAQLRRFCDTVSIRVITPGATAGESLHVLSALERRSARWDTDPESARSALSAAVSLVLRLLGRDPDPAKSREHVLLSVLAERRLAQGQNADIGSLMKDLGSPPMTQIGALPVNSFLKKGERSNLAAALNNLLASPTFCSWRKGTSLDVAEWVAPKNGRTPGVIVSVAHLDEEERALVLGVLLEESLSWVRALPGSGRLKALVVFDEVYGFLPPHPANPPTKRPIVALMKQARAFGVSVVVARLPAAGGGARGCAQSDELWFHGS